MSLGTDGAEEGTEGSLSGDGDGVEWGGAGGEDGIGESAGAFDGDGGREIGDGDGGEGASAPVCGDGVGEGSGGEEEETAVLNWTRRKARSRGERSSMNLDIVDGGGGVGSRCLFPEKM